jgi:hypothetical protein
VRVDFHYGLFQRQSLKISKGDVLMQVKVKKTISVLTATLFIFLTFSAWNFGSEVNDIFILTLLPLGVLIYYVNLDFNLKVKHLNYDITVNSHSKYYHLFRGKLFPKIKSVVFSFTVIVVFIWQYVNASYNELLITGLSPLITGVVYILAHQFYKVHFLPPFDQTKAMNTSTIIGGAVIFLGLWINAYYIDNFDTKFFEWTLSEAIVQNSTNAANKNSLLFPFIEMANAFETLKIWSVVHLRSYLPEKVFYFLPIILSLDIAMIGFFLPRVTVLMVYFIETEVMKLK